MPTHRHIQKTHTQCFSVQSTANNSAVVGPNDASYIQQYNKIQEDKDIDLCDTNAVATFAIIFHS